MIQERKYKREPGQGLIEFALVLPILLLVLVGLAEFARIFAIYTNLFNAAREGTRYGMANAADTTGILNAMQSKIALIDPSQVSATISYDSGPGTAAKSSSSVAVGDRVLVSVHYDVEPMLPILRPLLSNLSVDTEAARTISKVGGGGAPPPPAAAIPTATPTETSTPTATPTPTETPTPTATPTPRPIVIHKPLIALSRYVSGTAQPGETLSLWDNGIMVGSTVVQDSGYFVFDLKYPSLVEGHFMEVRGYGMSDSATVVAGNTPAPTATPTLTLMPTLTLTPTFTPTPGAMDIQIAPLCGPVGSNTITVYGYDWSGAYVIIKHIFGDVETQVASLKKNDFVSDFMVDVVIADMQQGEHTIQALYSSALAGPYEVKDSELFVVPCPTPTPTPTATPRPPNLIVEQFILENEEPISTCSTLTFAVSIANVGETATNAMFWVDLFVDPASPISPTDPPIDASAYWAAVNSLDAGASITLTLYLHGGVDTIGEHAAYVMADTLNGVAEEDETDNVAGPFTFTVSEDQCTPAALPLSALALAGDGAISGSTWLHLNGGIAPQGRVNVYGYNGDVLVAETISDRNGNYLLQDLAPGTYTVIGELVIDGMLYTDIAAGIMVNRGETTPYVTLYLHE